MQIIKIESSRVVASAMIPAINGAVAAPIFSKKLEIELAVERTSGTVMSYSVESTLGDAKGMNSAVIINMIPNRTG